MELNLQPIFGEINLEKFELFLNDMVKSKFFEINLIDILRISRSPVLVTNNCFNIILNSIDTDKLLKGPLSLCFKSKNIVNDWMRTINEFKECQIDSSNKIRDNKVLVDFHKVNKLIKDPINHNSERDENKLFYDNGDKVHIKKHTYIDKEIVIKQMMNNIVSTITKGSIQSNKVRRKMQNELKETIAAANKMQKQQDLVKSIVNKRIEIENRKKDQLRNIEKKNKEIQLLKAVKNRILKSKQAEGKKLQKALKRQINSERILQNKKAKNMINYLINKTKSPEKAADEARKRVLENRITLKQIKGAKIKLPKKLKKTLMKNLKNARNGGKGRNGRKGVNGKNGRKLILKNLTKKDIAKMSPSIKKILANKVAEAAKQAAKARMIFIPGKTVIYQPGSVGQFAKNVMKNKGIINYNRCIDTRILHFKNKKYIKETCKDIYGENVKILFILKSFIF
jgi:hypothetical protein